MHKTYESIREMLEREAKEIEKQGNLSPQTLDVLYKVMLALKATYKCIECEETGNSYGYSNRHNGRYSEDNFRYSQDRGMNSYRYSRDSAKDSMVNRLMQMADSSMNDEDRMAIMDCINKIK